MTGFEFDDVSSDPELWERRLHPEDRERVLRAIEARQSTGRLSIEYRWQCADGRCKYFHRPGGNASMIRAAARRNSPAR